MSRVSYFTDFFGKRQLRQGDLISLAQNCNATAEKLNFIAETNIYEPQNQHESPYYIQKLCSKVLAPICRMKRLNEEQLKAATLILRVFLESGLKNLVYSDGILSCFLDTIFSDKDNALFQDNPNFLDHILSTFENQSYIRLVEEGLFDQEKSANHIFLLYQIFKKLKPNSHIGLEPMLKTLKDKMSMNIRSVPGDIIFKIVGDFIADKHHCKESFMLLLEIIYGALQAPIFELYFKGIMSLASLVDAYSSNEEFVHCTKQFQFVQVLFGFDFHAEFEPFISKVVIFICGSADNIEGMLKQILFLTTNVHPSVRSAFMLIPTKIVNTASAETLTTVARIACTLKDYSIEFLRFIKAILVRGNEVGLDCAFYEGIAEILMEGSNFYPEERMQLLKGIQVKTKDAEDYQEIINQAINELVTNGTCNFSLIEHEFINPIENLGEEMNLLANALMEYAKPSKEALSVVKLLLFNQNVVFDLESCIEFLIRSNADKAFMGEMVANGKITVNNVFDILQKTENVDVARWLVGIINPSDLNDQFHGDICWKFSSIPEYRRLIVESYSDTQYEAFLVKWVSMYDLFGSQIIPLLFDFITIAEGPSQIFDDRHRQFGKSEIIEVNVIKKKIRIDVPIGSKMSAVHMRLAKIGKWDPQKIQFTYNREPIDLNKSIEEFNTNQVSLFQTCSTTPLIPEVNVTQMIVSNESILNVVLHELELGNTDAKDVLDLLPHIKSVLEIPFPSNDCLLLQYQLEVLLSLGTNDESITRQLLMMLTSNISSKLSRLIIDFLLKSDVSEDNLDSIIHVILQNHSNPELVQQTMKLIKRLSLQSISREQRHSLLMCIIQDHEIASDLLPLMLQIEFEDDDFSLLETYIEPPQLFTIAANHSFQKQPKFVPYLIGNFSFAMLILFARLGKDKLLDEGIVQFVTDQLIQTYLNWEFQESRLYYNSAVDFLLVCPNDSLLSHVSSIPLGQIKFEQFDCDGTKIEIRQHKPIGLNNLGSLCYLDSVLQMVFFIPPIRDAIYSYEGSDQFIKALQELYATMELSNEVFVSPEKLIKVWTNWDGSSLQRSVQQDASEAILVLFDRLNSLIGDCLTIRMDVTINDENSQRDHEENCLILPLTMAGCESISESLSLVSTPEVLNEHATRISTIQETSQFMILQLKRFEYDYVCGRRQKITTPFSFDQTIEVKGKTYELRGIIVHVGTAHGGHYYAFGYERRLQQWFKLNDRTVTPVSYRTVVNESDGSSNSHGYIFFYEHGLASFSQEPPIFDILERNRNRSHQQMICNSNFLRLAKGLAQFTSCFEFSLTCFLKILPITVYASEAASYSDALMNIPELLASENILEHIDYVNSLAWNKHPHIRHATADLLIYFLINTHSVPVFRQVIAILEDLVYEPDTFVETFRVFRSVLAIEQFMEEALECEFGTKLSQFIIKYEEDMNNLRDKDMQNEIRGIDFSDFCYVISMFSVNEEAKHKLAGQAMIRCFLFSSTPLEDISNFYLMDSSLNSSAMASLRSLNRFIKRKDELMRIMSG